MKIAVPTAEGKLSMHFGHCEKFTVFTVDEASKAVTGEEVLDAPPHEPGLLPRWLGEKDVNIIIAGGIGQRAISLFEQRNIRVICGAPSDSAVNIVNNYLAGKLISGDNACNH